LQSSWEDEDTGKIYSCVDLYFVSQDGSTFKVKYKFRPYFCAATKDKMELEVEAYIRRRYEGEISDIEIIEKEDLDLKNHLSGLKRKYLKLQFDTVQQLMRVRNDLLHVVEKNEEKLDAVEAFETIHGVKRVERPQDYINYIIDLREYDVPYHVRFAIDNDVRCGQWYNVSVSGSDVLLQRREDLLQRAEVHVCAFDIETTKLPLKFPDAEYDTVMMISYMIDGQGYLIINRECVGEDIEDLEYTPKPEFEGHFRVKNVPTELDLLKAWFTHMQEVKPGIYVTYNGDFFDWPFLEKRAAHHGIKMNEEIGFQCDNNQGECRAKFSCHLDCFAWVKRDSYLPQGSQGLKAVTKAKLGYDPLEVNPEDMVRFAMEQPQTMASYSVSDAVATYYLYMTYVHPFIFSLATIIPMAPDEVLRKGSGTLCEMLLMVQAFKANVICPNKHQADLEKFYNNRLLESETYIGGHVECLETGVFRSDLPTKFQLEPSAYEQLIGNLDRDLQYTIAVEGKLDIDTVTNYDEVKDAIKQKLVSLRDHPIREERPLIYHLDVAAMYPNIILTNRLQPPSIVTDVDCTACDFNRPGKNCLRKLEWVWRGETYMAKKNDYYHIKRQIESEMIQSGGIASSKPFLDLSKPEHLLKLKDRLKKYCQKAHKRVVDKPITEVREAGICMRENSFYVDTVRSECSIEFEVDGPYKAMILPASKEEGILIKKRYAVFNEDGTLAELKGFEIKRRGELKLIKVFQVYASSQHQSLWIGSPSAGQFEFLRFNIRKIFCLQAEVFDKFLHGSTLEECYSAVASVANRWLDLLDNQGIDIADSELLDFISESSTMSKSLVDYGEQKSCAVTTAKRLAEFLGDSMVKDKGLHCQYIVAREPQGTPVSERAVPVAIFETDPEIAKHYLRKWCRISSDAAIRSIVDWSYYKQRLSSAIQKIITIPAAMQKISNPVPRVLHPDWLHKKVREKDDRFRQRKLRDIFSPLAKDDGMQNLNGTGDMEDLLMSNKDLRKKSSHGLDIDKENNPNGASVGAGSNNRNKNQQNSITGLNVPLSSQIQNAAAAETVDKSTDYQGWLDAKKRKWKFVREQKKRRRSRHFSLILGDGHFMRPSSSSQIVTSLLTFILVNYIYCPHQIIQLASSTMPGRFFAWVVAEGIMFKIPINVPRVFYLNSKAPVTEEFPGRSVKKILPHGRPCFNLIEVVTTEELFRAEGKKLAAHLAEPDVEGIYETKIPPELNAVLQIGCVCKLDKSAKKRSIQDGWDLAELQMKTTAECSYLEQTVSFFYLYHSLSEGRAVYVFYFPTSFRIHAVVVNPFRNREISPSFLEKQFRDACQALGSVPENLTFHVDYQTSIDAGSKYVQRMLLEYSNARDNNYQALGWQATAGRTSMQRCAASTQWFNERISLARYAHVPLGNFELDWLLFTADVFFSRALRDQQQVLWMSDDGIPDLGGTYEGDTCFADEVIQPALTYPGAYRRVSVELKIHHLAVNSLLKSSQVDEMEGGSISGFGNDMPPGPHATETDFDDASLCAPAFQVLKQLIQRCISDAVSSGNVFADAILQHLYRWLCSPRSKLHDPALHRLLHNVMKKVFALLLAEFRKLGANVIFANFSKIIIDTGKVDLASAHAYCDSLLKTLQTRDLFEWIELEPVHFWHNFLFMDQYNYGGIQAKTQNVDSLDGDDDIDIVSSWNIAEYLPKDTQDHFVLIVSEFLYIPWKFMKEQVATQATIRDDTSCTPSITVMAAENLEGQVIEHLRDKISNYFADKLLRTVSDILHHFKGKSKSESDEPASREPDPHTHKGDAALEFIKHICAVLALDQNVQHDILRMRKNLLKLVRVKEFAPEAQFQDPFIFIFFLMLPNLTKQYYVGSYCNDCRDLDLCRDSTLQGQEWRCAVPQCGQPYHHEQMENALLQVVRQRERLYHLQDLVCLRCRQVKAAHLSEQCSCGGSFRCKEESSYFLSKMRVFLNVAVSQKFQLLQDCVQWILEVR
ncbi:DNA polymerase epsilon catalytic subunit A, partial [Dichanthelium oligosanthes]